MRAQKGEKQKPFLTPAREVGITEEKFCRSICSIRAPSTFSNPVDRVRVWRIHCKSRGTSQNELLCSCSFVQQHTQTTTDRTG